MNGTRLSVPPVVVHNQLSPSLPFKPTVEKFARDYEAAYKGEAPSTFSGNGWDSMSIITAAAAKVFKSGKAKLSDTAAFRAALRDAIEDLGTFQGIGGTFNMSKTDHDGLGETSAIMTVVQDGKFHVVSSN